jgi:hypothetical protein
MNAKLDEYRQLDHDLSDLERIARRIRDRREVLANEIGAAVAAQDPDAPVFSPVVMPAVDAIIASVASECDYCREPATAHCQGCGDPVCETHSDATDEGGRICPDCD